VKQLALTSSQAEGHEATYREENKDSSSGRIHSPTCCCVRFFKPAHSVAAALRRRSTTHRRRRLQPAAAARCRFLEASSLPPACCDHTGRRPRGHAEGGWPPQVAPSLAIRSSRPRCRIAKLRLHQPPHHVVGSQRPAASQPHESPKALHQRKFLFFRTQPAAGS
jgi:hypothetical protein